MDTLIVLLVLATMLEFYMLPVLVAWFRKHHQLHAITALNLLFGWTFLGWIGALIWAFAAKRDEFRPHRKKSAGQHHRKQSTNQSPLNFLAVLWSTK